MMARMPGVTTKELMARIGHASPRAALIYQHATTERDRLIADYLDAHIAAAEAAADEVRRAPIKPLRSAPDSKLTRHGPRHPRAIERPRPGGWREESGSDLHFSGGPPGPRTPHQKLKRLLLYQMS